MTKVCLNCGRRNSNTQIRCKTCGASLVRAVIVRDSPFGSTGLLLVLVGVLLVGAMVVWYLPKF